MNDLLKEDRVLLKKIEDKDLELLMSWRSNPEVYKWFYIQKEPLKWKEHYSWWLSRKNRIDWIILYDGEFRIRKIGSINVSDMRSDTPEVGLLIGESSFWGKGVGKKAVKLALNYLREKRYKKACANVLDTNIASKKLFESLGFQSKGFHRDREIHYEIKL